MSSKKQKYRTIQRKDSPDHPCQVDGNVATLVQPVDATDLEDLIIEGGGWGGGRGLDVLRVVERDKGSGGPLSDI